MKKIFSILLALSLFCSPVFASDLYPALGALTGGGTGALDKIDGTGLSDGDAAIVILSTGSYHYHLNATSGATEDSPEIISPNTNAGTKRWILVTPMGPFSHVRAETDAGQTITDSTITTIVFEDEDYDTLSEFNASTGIFTAVHAGYYHIHASAFFGSYSWAAGTIMRLYVYRDTTRIAYNVKESEQTATLEQGVIIGTSLYLAVGETVLIKVYQDTGSSKDLFAFNNRTYVTIDRIP